MKHSEQLNELAKALAEVQSEVPNIPLDSNNPFFKSKYSSLAVAVQKASPIVTKHGLSVSQFPGCDERGDTLTTWLLHSSGQFICEAMRLHLVKDDAQSHGSALTYAKRYAYMSVLGLVADEDDDGRAASQQPQASTSSRPAAKRAPQNKATKPVDTDTGEILEPLAAVIGKLDEARSVALTAKMQTANFPALDVLPPAAEKRVRAWCAELQEQQDKEAEF